MIEAVVSLLHAELILSSVPSTPEKVAPILVVADDVAALSFEPPILVYPNVGSTMTG